MNQFIEDNDMSGINRATPGGYRKYMLANPHYFKSVSGKDATKVNVEAEFDELRRKNLVAAASVSPHCRCKYCMGGFNGTAQ